MNNIHIETQGVKGGNTKVSNVGYVITCLRHQQDRITIDDFEGFGKDYKQRETQLIEIIQNGEVLFSGDKYELYDILRAQKKDIVNQDATDGPYLRAYKLYLQDNNLHDDSYQTTEEEAKEFLLLGLSPKKIKKLIQRAQDANNS